VKKAQAIFRHDDGREPMTRKGEGKIRTRSVSTLVKMVWPGMGKEVKQSGHEKATAIRGKRSGRGGTRGGGGGG